MHSVMMVAMISICGDYKYIVFFKSASYLFSEVFPSSDVVGKSEYFFSVHIFHTLCDFIDLDISLQLFSSWKDS